MCSMYMANDNKNILTVQWDQRHVGYLMGNRLGILVLGVKRF